MTKFFFQFKEPYFWPIFDTFPQFLGQKKFFQKIWLRHAQLDKGCQHHIKMQRNLMIQFQKNTQADSRTECRQTVFHMTLPATAGFLTSTTAVGWYLKVKDIEYDVGLTKNNCITVSMQRLSSVLILILMIQQNLGSNELNGHAHF